MKAMARLPILLGVVLMVSPTLLPAFGGAGAVADAELHGDPVGEPRILTEFVGLPDPVAWSVDPSTGTQYRRATALELAANGWAPGAYLVDAAMLDALLAGAPAGSLVVPVADDDARVVDLALASSEALGVLAATYVAGGEESFTPVIRTHRSVLPDIETREISLEDIAYAEVTTTDHGGLYGRAVVAGLRADILGPEASWLIEEVPVTGGVVPVRVALVQLDSLPESQTHCPQTGILVLDQILLIICGLIGLKPQCSDGLDNDGDFWVDYPADPGCTSSSDDNELDSRISYNFGLFGEIKWCTRNAGNWAALIGNVWGEIDAGFDGNGGTRANPVPAFGHCWIHVDQASANACDASGCTTSDGHAYTYGTCNGVDTCYLNRVWNDVSHARTHFTFPSLKFAQTQHDGPAGGNCGVAYFPSSGASVSLGRPYSTTGCRDYVSTHEAGHNFAGNHNNVVVNGCGTALAQSSAVSCRWNYFHNNQRAEINACVPNSWCPRSGTG